MTIERKNKGLIKRVCEENKMEIQITKVIILEIGYDQEGLNYIMYEDRFGRQWQIHRYGRRYELDEYIRDDK